MNKSVKKITVLGNEISKLGFGTMRLPQIDGKINQDEVNKMIKCAIENGINYFDTSFVYHDGNSEVALGIGLEPFERESYYLADKMSFWDAKDSSYLDKQFEIQLKKLKTDYIDFYLMHCLNELTYKNAKNVDAFKWALQKKKEGKIKYLGFSIHADYNLLLDVLDECDFDFAQIQYNYMDINDNPGHKGYEELVKRNIPIMIMEPLKGGALVNIPDNLTKPYQKLGGTNISYAFRWLAEKEGIAVILSGMSDMEQVKSNIEIFTDIKPLSEEEHNAIEEVKKNIESTQKVNCTGCKYCMPCPVGINIPQTFRAWNTKSMSNTNNWISGTEIDKKQIEKCVECKKCMSHCPQNIEIPNMLKNILSE